MNLFTIKSHSNISTTVSHTSMSAQNHLNYIFNFANKLKKRNSISQLSEKEIEVYSTSSPTLEDSTTLMTIQSYNSTLEPEDVLPLYQCSLNKEGIVLLKWEKIQSKKMNKHWNTTNLKVTGTLITSQWIPTKSWLTGIFKNNKNSKQDKVNDDTPVPQNKPSYIQKWDVEGMKVIAAPDVNDRMTFRVVFKNGDCCLIRANKLKEAQAWVDTLQSSANIADDLDLRISPVFYTLPRSRVRYRGL
ncbi:hypothetical protein K502DRAFT_326053 [Neoconidiobolus thromboides FSU 785]|nr:hypothetical protein K502DRAFT_326053 [Neoconidiobolus thromboides FSU 785]